MATTAKSSAATPTKKKTTAKTAAKVVTKAVTKAKPASRAAVPKAVPKAPAKRAAIAAATRKPSSPGKAGSPRISGEQRRAFIEVAAYYIAERHGFMSGREAEDWIAAEAEIDRLLKEGKLTGL